MDIKPQSVDGIDLYMPTRVDRLIPKEIPKDYPKRKEWTEWQERWFFKGLEKSPTAKPGIEAGAAMRRLACIQRSMEPFLEETHNEWRKLRLRIQQDLNARRRDRTENRRQRS